MPHGGTARGIAFFNVGIASILLFKLLAAALLQVPKAATRDQTYDHLNGRVPDDIKFDLHVLLVEHGKRCAHCCKPGTAGNRHTITRDQCPLVHLKKGSSGKKI